MEFSSFCRAHGLIMKSFYDDGEWHRVPTTDKPHKTNGAYKYLGSHGFVQNHATMDEVATWQSDKPVEIKYQNLAKTSMTAATATHEEVARKAAWMISQSVPDYHDYMMLKGFPDHKILTMDREGKKLGLLPMRVGNKLSSLQIIVWDKEARAWRKTFLKGGTTKGATFTIGQGDVNYYCEGMATALSIDKALHKANIKARVICCYSAQNMKYIASKIGKGIVIADNDISKTGQQVAESIGLPYWMSPVEGEDFNDFHLRAGDFKSMSEIKSLHMMSYANTMRI